MGVWGLEVCWRVVQEECSSGRSVVQGRVQFRRECSSGRSVVQGGV